MSDATRDRREIPTVLKLAGFGAVLVAVFGAALAIGGQVGPIGEPVAATHGEDHAGDTEPATATMAEAPGGLQISDGGYTLVPSRTIVSAGDRVVAFRIEGPDGQPVTEYEIEHEKELHLIAVRRDFTGFQHVHPERAADGTWRTPVDLTAGTWRIFADFTPAPVDGADATPLTLGTDLAVTGVNDRLPSSAPAARRVDTVDGYRVELAGSLIAGGESDLRFAVTRNGRPIADLQPYLGARGHLVALREGDLAYLHVHPTDAVDATGNDVGFAATVPSVGRYRLYLDFRVDGVVRTASFVLPSGESGSHEEEDHAH